MTSFLDLAQSMALALKSVQMYTSAHPRTREAVAASHQQLTDLLGDQDQLQFVASTGKAFVDGQPLEDRSPQLTALIRQVTERGLNGFRFERGTCVEEYLAFLETLALKPQRIEALGGFEAILSSRSVRHIRTSQTRYEEVREGEGGSDGMNDAPPAFAPLEPSATPERLAKDLGEALRAALGLGDETGSSGLRLLDLSGLGPMATRLGLGEGEPTPDQMDTLRQLVGSLPAETQLGFLAGLGTLPGHPSGLALGLHALAGEVLAGATVELMGKGRTWAQLKAPLVEILRPISGRERLLRSLATRMRDMGLDASQAEALLRHLDWEHLSLEARLLRVLEEGYLFDLTHEQRLALLRELLDLRRHDDFIRVQDILLEVLHSDLLELRLASTQTLAGIARWAEDPGLPPEIEAPLAEALRAHFAWEPDPPVHRWNREALQDLLAALVLRGNLSMVLADLSEIQGLCEFQAEPSAWRAEARDQLRESLARPALMEAATEQLFSREREDLPVSVYPYFEALGASMAQHLVDRLGAETDRTRRGRLVEALRNLGPLAVPPLLEALRAPAWYLVRNALSLLGDLGDAGILPTLAPLLRHPEPRVRRTAIRAMGRAGGPAAEPLLLPLLSATDTESLQEMLFVLGQLRSEAAVATLARMVQDRRSPESSRLQILETLAHIASPKSIPVLSDLLRRRGFFSGTEPLPVRLAAARALAALGTPEARILLQKILDAEPRGEEREALARVIAP